MGNRGAAAPGKNRQRFCLQPPVPSILSVAYNGAEVVLMKTALSRLRKERGLTQRELADLLHISQTSVSKYERGAAEPDLEMVLAMADFFGVSTDEFLRAGRRV